MKTNFDYSVTQVLKDEGGYSNNPSDPGGPTNYGITLADYRRYIKSNGTASDVKGMTVDQAKTIYKLRYWDTIGCDNLPSGVDYCLFDYGVNSGIGRVKKYLNSKLDPSALINKVCDERLAFLKSLKTWSVFGKGWGPRVARVRATALQMTTGAFKSLHPAVPTSVPVIVAGGAAMAATPYHYWPWIMGGAVVLAVVIGLIVHFYHKGTTA